MKSTDTIAAISSAPGSSGIGIIRVCGDEAIEICSKLFKPAKKDFSLMDANTHTVHYGNIVFEDNTLDEVLVIIMRGPHSYTGDDTVEIDCHGGTFVMRRVLDAVIKSGARAAEPGEFTKRAFLNGRMDMSQAEAVMELISAKNDFAVKSSIKQLKGNVSKKIKEIRDSLIYETAHIEAALDDPEHISLDGFENEFSIFIDKMIFETKKLLRTFDDGKVLREGIKTVILGKPNAGKSSILNLLLGEDRAIVTDIEGTTRDVLEEYINFGDFCLNIADTAGIRKSKDVIEQMGVDRAKELAKQADLILYVVDSSRHIDSNDRYILNFIKDMKVILLANKSDKEQVADLDEIKKVSGRDVIPFSAVSGEGKDELENAIREMFCRGEVTYNDQVYITNARHKEALENALEALKQVKSSVNAGMPEDFYTIDLMEAYSQFGLITGESMSDDLADEIFSKFCMGK